MSCKKKTDQTSPGGASGIFLLEKRNISLRGLMVDSYVKELGSRGMNIFSRRS